MFKIVVVTEFDRTFEIINVLFGWELEKKNSTSKTLITLTYNHYSYF